MGSGCGACLGVRDALLEVGHEREEAAEVGARQGEDLALRERMYLTAGEGVGAGGWRR